MFSRAVALLSCRFTASKRPLDVVSLFMRKKYARLKPKLPTQNKEVIIFPFLTQTLCLSPKFVDGAAPNGGVFEGDEPVVFVNGRGGIGGVG